MSRKNLGLSDYEKRYGPAANYIWGLKKKDRNELPWRRAYSNIRNRCNYNLQHKTEFYNGKGIKCKITPSELKEIFYRDKAWEFKVPSVDRKNPEGDYDKENVQWIDFDDNRAQRLMNNPYRKEIGEKLQQYLNKEFENNKWPSYVRRAFFRKCIRDLAK